MTKLEYLHLGSGVSVSNIEAISKLKNLVALSVENFQKINDYSPLIGLKNLESLSIEGDGLGPQYIHVNSLDFLTEMKQLRFFSFLTVRLKSKDYTPILNLENLEYLSLRPCRETKKLYDEFINH